MTLTIEEWRPIEGFPDYAVSSHGQVMRTASRGNALAGRTLKQQALHGYRYVYLSRDGSVTACRVHRLVCAAFHGPAPSQKHHAAHSDGNRENNFFGNLRWATPSQNMMDKHAHGTMPMGDANGARTKPDRLARGLRNGKHTKPEATPRGENHHSARLSEHDVRAIRQDQRSQRAIAAAYGVSRCAVANIKTGKTWGHVA